MIDTKVIGNRLRGLRGERSQQMIADLLGVSAMSVSKWERGESLPTDGLKCAIVELYSQLYGKDLTVQDIFFTCN